MAQAITVTTTPVTASIVIPVNSIKYVEADGSGAKIFLNVGTQTFTVTETPAAIAAQANA